MLTNWLVASVRLLCRLFGITATERKFSHRQQTRENQQTISNLMHLSDKKGDTIITTFILIFLKLTKHINTWRLWIHLKWWGSISIPSSWRGGFLRWSTFHTLCSGKKITLPFPFLQRSSEMIEGEVILILPTHQDLWWLKYIDSQILWATQKTFESNLLRCFHLSRQSIDESQWRKIWHLSTTQDSFVVWQKKGRKRFTEKREGQGTTDFSSAMDRKTSTIIKHEAWFSNKNCSKTH